MPLPVTWRPTSEAELATVIAAGDLEETHGLEVKQQIAAGQAGRRELAADLAQFAIDGGALLIGIAETREGAGARWKLAPVPLVGLSERVEQIARSSIEPPLAIRVHQFPSVNDPSLGYLVVEVPVSARAPHMVAGKYYGRGDKTRHALSDAEVVRFHSSRADTDAVTNGLLDAEIERDPYGTNGESGHLFLVAQPQIGLPDLALPLLRGDVHRLLAFHGDQRLHSDLRRWDPAPGNTTGTVRADGKAICSYSLERGRVPDAENSFHDSSALDVELREDGGIRVFVGRMTTTDQRHGVVVMDGLAVAYTLRLLEWARSVSVMTRHPGGWLFGIAATGLRGGSGAGAIDAGRRGVSTYNADSYRATASASLIDLAERPGEVARQLVGRLLRGLGSEQVYQDQIDYLPDAVV